VKTNRLFGSFKTFESNSGVYNFIQSGALETCNGSGIRTKKKHQNFGCSNPAPIVPTHRLVAEIGSIRATMLAIIQRLRRRSKGPIDLNASDNPDNQDAASSDIPPPVTAEGLLKRVPAESDQVFVLNLEKSDCAGKWHKRRAIITSKSLIFARDEDEYIREEIPLKLLEGIQVMQDPDRISQKGSKRNLEPSDYIDLRSKQVGKEEPEEASNSSPNVRAEGPNSSFASLLGTFESETGPIFDIFSRVDGLDSVIRYSLRTSNKQDLEGFLKALQQARDRIQQTLPGFTVSSRIQERLARIYSKYITFGLMAFLIFSNFIIDIVQAEMQAPPASSASAVFQILEILFTTLFTIDLLVNFAAHWPYPFLSKGWNLLDVVVISLSIASSVFDSDNSVTSFRAIRAIRAVRLLKGVEHLREIVDAIVSSVSSVPPSSPPFLSLPLHPKNIHNVLWCGFGPLVGVCCRSAQGSEDQGQTSNPTNPQRQKHAPYVRALFPYKISLSPFVTPSHFARCCARCPLRRCRRCYCFLSLPLSRSSIKPCSPSSHSLAPLSLPPSLPSSFPLLSPCAGGTGALRAVHNAARHVGLRRRGQPDLRQLQS
jgi:hypothetical protein